MTNLNQFQVDLPPAPHLRLSIENDRDRKSQNTSQNSLNESNRSVESEDQFKPEITEEPNLHKSARKRIDTKSLLSQAKSTNKQ